MKPALIVLALAAVSCAHTPPPPAVPPPWTELPVAVSEAVCARVHGEAISQESPVAIVKTTQRLVNASSVAALSQAYSVTFAGSAQFAEFANARLKEMPVTVTAGGGTCAFHPIDAADQRRVTDVMLLQLSSPFVNPFGKTECGLFARLSIGGHDATWYWVPIAERKGQWLIGLVMPLDLHEQ